MTRYPNNVHWRLIETAFREIAGPSWRRIAAQVLGVEKWQLRTLYDRDLTGPEIDTLLARIGFALEDRADDLKSYVSRVDAMARIVDGRKRERLHEIERLAGIEETRNSPFNQLAKSFLADLLDEAA
ncbi:hypothetical protein ACVWZK_003080 [Bradyrhizobium sp. GM0.4]